MAIPNPLTGRTYDLQDLKEGFENPRLILNELQNNAEAATELCMQVSSRAVNKYTFRMKHGKGVDFVSEDWDTMIILDACRFDTFKNRHSFERGHLESRISRGSNSWMFVKENFEGKQLHDTVYVSANPWSAKLDEGTFHASILLHHEWDAEERTVMPEDVTEAAKDAHERFPNKAIIVHYMQPHTPYIGEKGQKIREQLPRRHRGWHKYNGLQRDGIGPYQGTKEKLLDGMSVWDGVREGHITHRQLEEAYEENFDIVSEYAADLIDSVSGKVVVTADHGELLGDTVFPFRKPQYSHPYYVKSLALCQVPWFVTEHEERRTIETDPPVGKEGINDAMLDESDIVKQRLRDFGYLQ